MKPKLHFTAPYHWINDPNGLIYYKGNYHIFYQHFPYDNRWGTMHWGHAITKDFVNFEHLPIALYPSKDFDRNGCFSGSAIEIDGQLYLYYTAIKYAKENPSNVHNQYSDDDLRASQALVVSSDGIHFDNVKNKKQIIPMIQEAYLGDYRHTRDPKVWKKQDGKYAMVIGSKVAYEDDYCGKALFYESEDGIHFEKYEGNPVLTAPEGIPTDMFRDPKVWKHEDTYYMVCGASRNNRGMALLYRSKNMLNWEFFNVLAESRGEWGFMWECPDFYPIGDKYVLTFSPMDSGDHTSVYLVGDFDYETGSFYSHVSGEINWGFDYYAPQSFLAPDGRRIMVGWANEWEWMPSWKDWGPTYKEGWCGFFNIPMEVRLMKDSTLQFLPIKEIESLRQGGQFWDNLVVTEDELELKAGDGVTFELKMKIDLEKTDADKLEFTLRCGEGKKTVCMFDFKKAEMTVNRNNADGWSRGISRSVMYLNNNKELDVHILSDQSSLEIFTSEYQNNHSNNIFAGNFQNQLKVRAYGGSVAIKDIETYGLKDCYC